MTDERVKELSFVQRALMRPEMGAFCGVILVIIFFLLIAADNGMFNPDGIRNWSVVSAQFAIIAVGACLLMIAGEFDLSVGSMIGFAGMVLAISTVHYELPMWLGIIAAFAGLIRRVADSDSAYFTWLKGDRVIRTAINDRPLVATVQRDRRDLDRSVSRVRDRERGVLGLIDLDHHVDKISRWSRDSRLNNYFKRISIVGPIANEDECNRALRWIDSFDTEIEFLVRWIAWEFSVSDEHETCVY